MRFMDLLPAVIWSAEARREIPVRASGRRLVLDYFATRCCGRNLSIGDLHLRWIASDEPIDEEYLPLRAPIGVEAYIQENLVAVVEAARGTIGMRGCGPFRRPVVELAEGAVWLDFIGACRTRSPLRH
jgi:hypothetical protein